MKSENKKMIYHLSKDDVIIARMPLGHVLSNYSIHTSKNLRAVQILTNGMKGEDRYTPSKTIKIII